MFELPNRHHYGTILSGLYSRVIKALYLINDKHNSFDHVIDCLVSICEHDDLQAEQCALITHYNGACEIATGNKDDLIHKKGARFFEKWGQLGAKFGSKFDFYVKKPS